MSRASDATSVEHLLVHAEWLRRLAASLVGSEESADLVQDTWTAALRSPPTGEPRAWLAQVLRNLLSKRRRRTGVRNRLNAEASAFASHDPVPSADELLERARVQRELASLVMELSEPYRRTLLLRYYEGKTAAEIARALEVPAGTVRWRLKTALDQLRGSLDKQHSDDRGQWRRLLAPLLPSPRRSRAVALPAVASAGALLVAMPLLFGKPGAPPASPLGDPNEAPGRRLAVFSATGAVRADPVSACPEVESMRQELAARERELEAHDPLIAFYRGVPNSVAYERFSAVVAKAIEPVCGYSVECRSSVCRVPVLVPEGVHPGSCFRNRDGTTQGVPREYLDARRPVAMRTGGIASDALSGETLGRIDVFFRLASADAEPVHVAAPPVRIAPGRHRKPPASSRDREPRCRADVLTLHDRLTSVEARLDAIEHPATIFPLNDPNPELQPSVVQELKERLVLSDDQFPFTVECRGLTCAVNSREPEGQEATTSWLTWWRQIDRGDLRGALIADAKAPMAPGTIWVTVRPESERDRPSARSVLCTFVQRAREARVLERCQEAFVGPGSLSIQIEMSDPDGRSDSPRHLMLHHGGSLDALPLGRCIVTELQAIAADIEAPDRAFHPTVEADLRSGLRWSYTMRLPSTGPLWGDTCAPRGPLRNLE
jgi:RNA polymerase sigma-70 factor (ECF subfamily)